MRSLLHDLQRRCLLLRDRLATASTDADVSRYALHAYRSVEIIRRDVEQLLTDPSLGVPALLPNYLQLYKRWQEGATLIEAYPLLFIERYAEADRRLTRLCLRIAEQVGWPLPFPLVMAFSTHYYWTQPTYNLIAASATEGESLLGLPDLCHELGHILVLHHEGTLVGGFVQELVAYIREEQRRVVAQRRPTLYQPLYDQLYAQWMDRWLWEFVSDMVATYLVGPAYGWQHVRLCAGISRPAYFPTLGQSAEHPADEARLRGILAVLNQMGAATTAIEIQTLWDTYLAATGDTKPADYEVCYPQSLVTSLARSTIAGCRTLNLRSFDLGLPVGDANQDLVWLIGEAWERFIADPQDYPQWERLSLSAVWRDLGFTM